MSSGKAGMFSEIWMPSRKSVGEGNHSSPFVVDHNQTGKKHFAYATKNGTKLKNAINDKYMWSPGLLDPGREKRKTGMQFILKSEKKSVLMLIINVQCADQIDTLQFGFKNLATLGAHYLPR